MQQTGIPGEFDESSRAVPYMPRAKQGIGRRPKRRRVSPASAIEVEQIEEEGVTEPVDVEMVTQEVAEIEIVEFGEDVVMWVLDLVIEKVWADRDWQADRFLRYASLTSLVVREWKRQGGGRAGPFIWAVRRTDEEFGMAGLDEEYTACEPFNRWPRMECALCREWLCWCKCERECACGSVSKWSWGRVGGLCACAEAPGVVCEAKKILDA